MYKIIVIFILIFSACSVTVPHIAEYRITSDIKIVPSKAKECKTKSLKVMQSFSSSALMSKEMRYRQSSYKEFSFTESKWAQSPNRAINSEIINSLRASELFESVSSYKSRGRSDLVLESSIESFVQTFDANSSESFVNVVIYMTLIESKSSKIISSKRMSKTLKVRQLNAEGGVSALSHALESTLLETREWLNGVCK